MWGFMNYFSFSQFATGQQTSTAKFPSIFQKYKKAVLALRVNEIKVTSRNTFIGHIPALKSDKESKSHQGIFF